MHRPGLSLAPIARFAAGGSLALAAAFATVGTVGAYPAPAGTASLASSCSTVASGGSCSLTFTLLDSTSHGVSGASVSYTVSGVSAASVSGSSATNGSGVSSATFNAGSDSADCGKTATIIGTANGSNAQTTVQITCPSTGGLLGGLLHNVLGTLVTDLTGGILNGVLGGSTYNLTVPQGSLPAGTHVDFLSPTAADLAALNALLTPGTSLAAVFDIAWPAGVTASSPITLVIHNAAFHAGDHIYKLVNNSLQQYSNATVSEGVATITFSNDPTFAVVAPTASVPGGLGNEGAQPPVGAATHTAIYAMVAGALLVFALIAAPVLRRRREQV
jgi:hypothetical protein